MVLTCPKCRHQFPPQCPPPPLPPAALPAATLTPTPAACRACAPTLGGAAPVAWPPLGLGPGPCQPPPAPPPSSSPTPAMLSLSISASSASTLNGGHVVVNTMPTPQVASQPVPSISVTATLPALAGLGPMWPWAQSGAAPPPPATPSWALVPSALPAMPAQPLVWASTAQRPVQQAPQQLVQPQQQPWPTSTQPMGQPMAQPLTLGLELFHGPPPPPPCAKGAQYLLTGGGILHERGHHGGHRDPRGAPVLLQTRPKPGLAGGPAGAGCVPEQSPSTPLSFVLPGGVALAGLAGLAFVGPEAPPLAEPLYEAPRGDWPDSPAGSPEPEPESELRLLQATTQALKASGWYYEGFSWQESAATLRSAAPGTFLVRDSSDPRFLFSLSVQTDRGPTSVRLLYVAGGFRLDAEPHLAPTMPLFPCVLQLVEHYVANRGKRGSSVGLAHAHAHAHAHTHGAARNREQVWVDARGQMYSHILLTEPRRHTVPGLQHLARLAVHRQLRAAAAAASAAAASAAESPSVQQRSERLDKLELPATLCRYLKDYPFTL